MEPHQQRVIDEKSELDEKMVKLGKFLTGDLFRGLSGAEQKRLMRQASYMRLYSDVLAERIEAF